MALTKPMQQARTLTANNPPANGVLLEGQLSVEFNPPRLWVGGPGGASNLQVGLGVPVSISNGGTGVTTLGAPNNVTTTGLGNSPLVYTNGSTLGVTYSETDPIMPGLIRVGPSTFEMVGSQWQSDPIDGGGKLSLMRIRGTLPAPTPVLNNDIIGTLQFGGRKTGGAGGGTADWSNDACFIRASARENWTTSAAGSALDLGVTIPTSESKPFLRLYADGTNYYLSFPGDQVRLRGGATEFAMQESVSGFGAYYTVATNNWWMGQNLAVGGNITATGTITPSDSRLKQAVQSYGAGLDAICTLQPIKFEYSGRGGTTEGEAHIGLSVDEAEAVLPEAVSPISSYRGDKQPDPGEEENPYKGLDYTAVTCALINAVKELAAKVAALESRPR